MSVRVIGLPEAKEALVEIDPGIRPRLQPATRAAVFAVKPYVVRGTLPESREMAQGVRVKPGKQRPSTILSFSTWFAHFVIQGTRDHGPRRARVLHWNRAGASHFARHVRGTPPHPILEVAADQGRAASDAAFVKALTPRAKE